MLLPPALKASARLRPPALGQPPEELAESILDKEGRIAEIIVTLKAYWPTQYE
jgi:hypothetical protein